MKRFCNTENIFYFFLIGALLALLVTISFYSLTNSNYISKLFIKYSGIDKPVHFFEYFFIFSAIYFLTSFRAFKFSEQKRIVIAIFLSLSISLIDEVHQTSMASRSFEYADFLANTIGIVTGLIIIFSKKTTIVITASVLAVLFGIVALLAFDSHMKIKHYYKGLEHEKNSEYRMAKEEYILALNAGNKSPSLYNSIAWLEIEFLKDNPQAAYEFASKAIAIKPNNADYLDTYGWVLLHLDRPEEAIIFLKKAFELKPDIYSIHLHLGASYYAIGEYEKSLYHLQKQIELNSDNRYATVAKNILEKIEKETVEKNK